jgi:hypothetical protein
MATPNNQFQISEKSILDQFNRQTYLGTNYSVSHIFSVGTSETALMYLSNSQTTSNVKAIFQNFLKAIDITNSQSVIINVYVNPTISANGTALTPVNLRPASSNNSIATITYNPTASANGTLVDAIGSSSTSNGNISEVLKILDQGQSILVTGIASAASTSVNVILQWYEL